MKFSDVISRSFSTAQVARLTGLTPRQLDHWDRRGFVQPSVQRAAGYGSARLYSFEDVVLLRVAARLRSAGVGLAKIRRCAEAIGRIGGARGMGGVRLVVAGSQILWARSDEELIDLLKGGQLVLVFSLGDTVEETAGEVARLNREGDRESEPGRRAAKQIF